MAETTINAHSSSGHILGRDTVWATARTLATGTSASDGFFGAEATGGNFDIYRGFFKFDLSSIPAGSSITALSLKVYLDSKDTTNDFAAVTSAHTAPDTTLTTADFDSLTVDSPTEYSARSANVSTLTTGAYITFILNATAIAVAAPGVYFKVACRSSKDVDNSTPTGRSYWGFGLVGGANPTQLVVTYTPPSGGSYSFIM